MTQVDLPTLARPSQWSCSCYKILAYHIIYNSISSRTPSVGLSVRPSILPSVRPSVSPFVLPSVRPYVRPPLLPSARPSVRPSVRSSVYFKDRSLILLQQRNIAYVQAIMKLRRSGEEFWELLQAASVEIAENNVVEMTIEKRKEFLSKVTGDMSKDQRSEIIQQSSKCILHRQGVWVKIHS